MNKNIIVFIFSLLSISCKEEVKKRTDKQIFNQTTTNSIEVDIKEKEKCIIDNFLYSNLIDISWGVSWIDEKSNKEYIFRIIVSQVGEEEYLYREFFELKEDGPIHFVDRVKISPKQIGLEYFNTTPIFKWTSYNTVDLTIDDKSFKLELTGNGTD